MSSELYFLKSFHPNQNLVLENRDQKIWLLQRRKLPGVLSELQSGDAVLSSLQVLLSTFFNHSKMEIPEFLREFELDLGQRPLRVIQRRISSSAFAGSIWDSGFMGDVKTFLLDERVCQLAMAELSQLPRLLASQSEVKAVRRDELMKLIMAQKEKKYPGFKGYVMDVSELPTFLAEGSFPEGSHLNLLLRDDVHYMAAVLKVSAGQRLALVADAAQDPRILQLQTYLQSNWGNTGMVGSMDRIQFDRSNCAHYSLDFLIQLHKDQSFSEKVFGLTSQLDEVFLRWEEFPPQFLRLCNSLKAMAAYKEIHVDEWKEEFKDGVSLNSYLAKKTRMGAVKGCQKLVNGAMEDRIEKIKGKLSEYLESCAKLEDLDDLVYQPAWEKLKEDEKLN